MILQIIYVLTVFLILQLCCRWYTVRYRNFILKELIKSASGRTALAEAMVEPIRRSLEYQAVGIKLLQIETMHPKKASKSKRVKKTKTRKTKKDD